MEHPPEPPDEPRREEQASEHRHQADVASLELAGHRIHQVFMAKMARVPVLFIHEPASVIPVGFW